MQENNMQNIYVDAKRAMDGTLANSSESLKVPAVNNSSNETKISIILPTTAYFMSGVRDFTMNIVQNMTGFSEKWAFRFQSIVDELTNNAIEHGSTQGQNVKVTFISVVGESITVSVEDSGTGPSKISAEELTELIKERKIELSSQSFIGIRGRGLAQIVSQWTDELKFDNLPGGGLRITAIKYLKNTDDIV